MCACKLVEFDGLFVLLTSVWVVLSVQLAYLASFVAVLLGFVACHLLIVVSSEINFFESLVAEGYVILNVFLA